MNLYFYGKLILIVAKIQGYRIMVRCSICGWDNPKGLRCCEKCNAPLTYDVFISYSRKDYVDDAGNVLPNNMLSKIKEAFKVNGISYWFDEEGIYSGDEFASVLTNAIRNSRIFLFVSSVNSNQSKWTSNEISTALEFKKPIIPFRVDNSPYNDSVMMKIISFDYIECKDEEKAMSKLLRAVEHHLTSIPRLESHWRNIGVPKGARGTVVAFNVDGKWEEHVFGEESCKKKGGKEFVVPRPTPNGNILKSQESSFTPVKSPYKYQKNLLLWLAVAIISLLLLCGGAIVFWHKENVSEIVDSENIATINEEKDTQPVDLGLPSGTMWADRNIGAATASDFGNLYSWGEIITKEDYSISAYVEQLKPLQKITQSKHDVAVSELGGEWSMPTEEQIKELLSECKWYWKKVDGHNGYEIEGKNGNRIFLPASGWNRGTAVEFQNQYGYYWTSERSSNTRFARSLQFPKNGKGIVGNGDLHVGRSVRAVLMCEAVAE